MLPRIMILEGSAKHLYESTKRKNQQFYFSGATKTPKFSTTVRIIGYLTETPPKNETIDDFQKKQRFIYPRQWQSFEYQKSNL